MSKSSGSKDVVLVTLRVNLAVAAIKFAAFAATKSTAMLTVVHAFPRASDLLGAAGGLAGRETDRGEPDRLRAKTRVSGLDGRLFLHSSFPTNAGDADFFGPDSYRFVELVTVEMGAISFPGAIIVDIGTGAGVGAIVLGERCSNVNVIATDINPKALDLARINALSANNPIEVRCGDILADFDQPIELVLANPSTSSTPPDSPTTMAV